MFTCPYWPISWSIEIRSSEPYQFIFHAQDIGNTVQGLKKNIIGRNMYHIPSRDLEHYIEIAYMHPYAGDSES